MLPSCDDKTLKRIDYGSHSLVMLNHRGPPLHAYMSFKNPDIISWYSADNAVHQLNAVYDIYVYKIRAHVCLL